LKYESYGKKTDEKTVVCGMNHMEKRGKKTVVCGMNHMEKQQRKKLLFVV